MKGKNYKESENLNEEVVDPADVAEQQSPELCDNPDAEQATDDVTAEPAVEEDDLTRLSKEVEQLKADVEKEKKEYLFLMAEFDNYRKRTMREKSELIKNAAEGAFKGILSVVDDMERAIKASEDAAEVEALRQGLDLIYKKLVKYLEQNGVKPIATTGEAFDDVTSEAITVVPVPDEKLKGTVIDTIEKGYYINEKVLRHAKVVVGQ
ncbi:MAG: nucleotide exchange factor GrpE [Muribaculaceae bacterium]|nr:nucleotide exchange factor GrpE [Muribaculaceae bacterium]